MHKTRFQVLVDKSNVAATITAAPAATAAMAPNAIKKSTVGVFGELQNRPNSKLQDIKPRVDTRWTKPQVAARQPLQTANGNVKTKINAINNNNSNTNNIENNVVVGLNKKITSVLTRANSKKTKNIIEENKLKLKNTLKQKQQQKQEREEIIINNNNEQKIVHSHSRKLLENVEIENIDENDENKPALVTEYVNDIYNYLFDLENEQLIRPLHLSEQTDITARMRGVLINWINEVHDQFHLAVETYHMTVSIVDNYLQLINNTKRSNFQLVGVSALFIAAKYEELFPPTVSDLSYITDDSCDITDILRMEMQILKVLDCNLSRPLCIHFLRRFSKAAKAEPCHHTAAKYFLELATIDYELSHYKPSHIAAASLLLALHLFNMEKNVQIEGFTADLWTPTLIHYSKYEGENLQKVMLKLAYLAYNEPNAKLDAVYRKYEHSKYQCISTSPEMYGTVMKLLIGTTTT